MSDEENIGADLSIEEQKVIWDAIPWQSARKPEEVKEENIEATKLHITVNEVLQGASENNLKKVIVIGMTEDNDCFYASSGDGNTLYEDYFLTSVKTTTAT